MEQFFILKEEIRSYENPKRLYGEKGERVKLIAIHDDVLIVEGKAGRFPVLETRVRKSII